MSYRRMSLRDADLSLDRALDRDIERAFGPSAEPRCEGCGGEMRLEADVDAMPGEKPIVTEWWECVARCCEEDDAEEWEGS